LKSKPAKGLPASLKGVDGDSVMRMYRVMVTIRAVEDAIAGSIAKGEIGCPCHLYSGQEAVATGVCANLNKDDWVYSSHRSHGHFLAKGGSVAGLMAEVYCREGGTSGGRGGSMHLSSPEIGFPGSSAIVSGTISLAVGSALAFKIKGTKRIATSFFGDGAADEGVFYESLNLAALYKLPILFVCENNLYSTHLPISKCLAETDLVRKAEAMGVPGERIDGNDAVSVYRTSKKLIAGIRKGGGPRFLECMTYRHRGHVGPNFDLDKGLRPRKEFDRWIKKDPILNMRKLIVSSGIASAEELDSVEEDAETDVKAAQSKAKKADWPSCASDGAFAKACWRGRR